MSRIPNAGGKGRVLLFYIKKFYYFFTQNSSKRNTVIVLLQNWFEERATRDLDGTVEHIKKRGHPQLLTNDTSTYDETTHNVVYTPPAYTAQPNAPLTKLRYQQAYEQALAEVVS